MEVSMESNNMQYNSLREDLIMPEYGRNVQKLVNHARTLEDPEFRQKFVERVVELMYQMNPQSKNVLEYREKLWKHVFHIAQYDLDVVPPNGEIPKPIADYVPEQMEYPEENRRFRHYGFNVQRMIKKAMSMEKGPKQDAFVEVIGSFMKLAYKNWNSNHYVSDENIKNDLKVLSKGELSLDDNASLDGLSNSVKKAKPTKRQHTGRNNKRSRSHNNNRNKRNHRRK